ncbi:hypothetical protein [Halobacillus sp. B23F22_1]
MIELLLAGILVTLIIIARNIKLIGEHLTSNPKRKNNSSEDDN